MVPDNLFGYPTNVTQLITAINPNGRPREDAEEEESGITLEQYAAAKRLPLDFLESLNLKDANYDFSPAVRIPYPNDLGKETYHRYRVALKAEPRFKAPPKHLGYKPIPYGLQVLKDAREMGYKLLIVEGESDAQVLWYNDVPALGIPGVQAWKKFGKEWAGYLEGIPRLLVPVESDEGGERFWALLSTTERIRDRLRRVPITSPALKDIGALWSHAVDAGREDEFKSVLHGMVWIHSHADNLTIPSHVIDTVRATDVITKPISWLWNRRIPEGKLTMFDGDPDVGKSVVTMDIAARVSRGRAFPDGAVCAAGPVLICNVEDGMDDTIVPRLNAHGADLSRIFLFQSVPDAKGGTRLLELPQDILLLENAVARHQAKLLILDPVLTMLGGDANKDQDARKALAPIRDMAEKTGVAVVCVRHLNKNVSLSAIQRGGGNMGLIGVARAGSFFAQHPNDDRLRVMAPHKSNVAEKPPSLTYRVVTSEVHDTARVEWIGVTDHDANSLAAGPMSPHEKSVLDEAIEFLHSELENGSMWAKQVYKDAHDAGISDASLRRAKAVLRIRSQKVGTDGWQWSLPEKDDPNPPDGDQKEHVEHVEHLQNFDNGTPENSAYVKEGAQGAQHAQGVHSGFEDDHVQKPIEPVRAYDFIDEDTAVRQLIEEISSTAGPIVLDTETSSLNVNEAKVRVIQIRTLADARPVVVDCQAVDVLPLLDVLKDKHVLAHNAVYDLAVLASYYGYEHQGPVSDTMLMFQVFYGGTGKKAGLKEALKAMLDVDVSKAEQAADWLGALTPEMLDYAASDVRHLHDLYAALKDKIETKALGLEPVVDLEHRMVRVTAHMSAVGMPVDEDMFAECVRESKEAADKKLAELDAFVTVDVPEEYVKRNTKSKSVPEDRRDKVNWNSPEQALWAFKECAGIEIPSTNKEILPEIDHPMADALIEYRKALDVYKRFRETKVIDGRVYAKWNQLKAKTGRMSCEKPPLQGIPEGLRRAFVAPTGHKLVISDLSQIEIRVLATLCGDENLRADLEAGNDVHRRVAASVFGKAYDEVTDKERKLCKALVFGTLYGLGLSGFTARVNAMTGKHYTKDQVDKKFRQPLFSPYPKVRVWMNKVAADFENGKTVSYTRLGRRRLRVPDVPAALNTPIQAGALDVMKAIAVAAYDTKQPKWSIIGLVHDEILIEVPEEQAEYARDWLHDIMVRVGGETVNHGIPEHLHVKVDAGTKVCDSWAEKE